jgi:hypothetical protein
MEELKDIVKGKAELNCVLSGGIAVYYITSINNRKYQLEIDLSDKHDVGDTAAFDVKYDKCVILMRWIRRAVENGTLIEIK